MDSVSSKCLLCLVKVKPVKHSIVIEDESRMEREEVPFAINNDRVTLTNNAASTLQKQLDVIFLLKKVLQLSPFQLGRFLKVRGNPEDWISLCGSCNDLVRNVKEIFFRLERISKKYDEAKMKVEERIRAASLLKEVGTKSDFILDEVRETVCKRKKGAVELINFLEGDSQAQHLLQSYKKRRLDGNDRVASESESQEEEAVADLNDFSQGSSPLPGFESLEMNSEIEIKEDPQSTSDRLDDRESVLSSNMSYKSPPSSSPSSSDFEEDNDDDEDEEDDDDDNYKSDEDSDDDYEVEAKALRASPRRSNNQHQRKRKQDLSNSRSETFSKKKELNSKFHRNKASAQLPIKRSRPSSLQPSTRFNCSLCRPKKKTHATTFSKFLAHVHRVHQVPYKCTQCDHGFKSLDPQAIISHYYFNHKDLKGSIPLESRAEEVTSPELPEIPWWCPTCSAKFPDEKFRDIHIFTDHGNHVELERSFKCEHCPNTYFSEDELNAHVLLIHPQFFRRNQLQCDQCPESFKTEKTLRYHRIKFHNLDLYKCLQCDMEYKNERNLVDHINHKHADPEEKKRLEKVTCKPCRKIFSNEEKCRLHMKKYHNDSEAEEQLTCHVCKKMFKQRRGLKFHLIKFHGIVKGNAPKIYTCKADGCQKKFYAKDDLIRHMTKHTNRVKVTCTSCQKEFVSQNVLDKHELLIHKIVKPSTKNIKFYDCPKCEQRFQLEKHLKSHSLTCKGKLKVPLECDICQTKCATSKDLRTHMRFKHRIIQKEEPEEDVDEEVEAETASLPCPHCGKLLLGELRLERHIKEIHQRNKPKYSCSLCSEKKFREPSYLEYHMARNHDIGTENYLCYLCNTFCVNKTQRKRHVCGVKDTAMVICSICGVEFTSKYDLRRHTKTVHEKQLDVACDLCEFRTTNLISLRKHQAAKHGIGIKCQEEDCQRFFVTEKEMGEHVKKVHSEGERERSFLCTECGKGFYDELALTTHRQAMHLNKDSKPYKCKVCGKGFATASYRSGHMKTHRKKSKSEVIPSKYGTLTIF